MSLSILLLDTEPRTRNGYLLVALADALRTHPFVRRLVVADHGDAIVRFREERLDTVLAFGGSERHTAILARLCRMADLSILWTTEDPYQLPGNVRTSGCFDLVFTNDGSSLPAYGGRAHHLPLAASEMFQDLDVLGDDRDYLYDVLFIGTAWPNRVRTLNRIADALPRDLKLKIALPGNAFTGTPELTRSDLLVDWRCGHRDFARFANASRVVLTLPRRFSAAASGQATGSTPPPRLFETALAGGFQVVASPDPELLAYYDPGSDLLTCADDDELVSTIEAVLREPSRRIDMARRARSRTRREHLYSHRLDRMFAIVEARSAGRPAARPPAAAPSRRTVLFVTHNRAGRFAGGGVEIYQEALAEALAEAARDIDVVFLFPGISNGRTVLVVEAPGSTEEIEAGTMDRRLLSDPHIESVFARILIDHRVDLVHVHHLLHLPLSLPRIARSFGVPTLWQVHDYHLICDRYQLVTLGNRFCDVVETGRDQCDACLLALDGHSAGSKARRDAFTASLAEGIDAYVASTPFSGDYLRAFFPTIAPGKIHVVELPSIGSPPAVPATPERGGAAPARFDVAVPGNLTDAKGGACLIDIVRLCAEDDIQFHVLGRVEGAAARFLDGAPPGRVTSRGGYDHHEIAGLLSGCQVSLHLSVWPETYAMSLTEAWQAGVIPIVTDLGGPGDRVRDGVDGLKVPPNDAAAAVRAIRTLRRDEAARRRMRDAIARKRFPSPAQHVAAMRRLYERLFDEHPVHHTETSAFGPSDFTTFDSGIRLNAPAWTTADPVWDDGPAPARAAPRLPATSATTTLSPEERSLPVHAVADGDGAGRVSLDGFAVDGAEAGVGARRVASRSVGLRGWLVGAAREPPRRTLARIRGSSGPPVLALLVQTAREDVAALLRCHRGGRWGFEGTIDTGSLPDGLYAVDILQATAGRLVVASDLLLFAVRASLASGAADPVPAEAETGRRIALAAPSGTLRVEGHNLPAAGDVLIGAEHDDAWIRVSGLPAPDGVASWTVVFAGDGPDGGRYVADLVREAAPAAGAPGRESVIVAALRTIAPGSYAIGVLAEWPDRARFYGTGMRLCRTPGRALSARLPRPPAGFRRPLWNWPHRLAGAVDDVTERTLADGEAVVTVRGWSFAGGLGAPLYTLALVADADGREACCVGPPRSRPDVARRTGAPEAAFAGFELDLPRAALAGGRVRVFQRYAGRTLEWRDVDARLRPRLATARPEGDAPDSAGRSHP